MTEPDLRDDPRWRASWLSLAGWIVLSLAAGALGGLSSQPGAWYARLAKPDWTPPNSIFGPVWTLLYLLMGVAIWLVWARRPNKPELVNTAVGVFLLQLILNAAWSWLFFQLHRPDVALVELVVLWAFILLMLFSFARVRPLAALLVLPYLAWVTFAGVLNASIWFLNIPKLT